MPDRTRLDWLVLDLRGRVDADPTRHNVLVNRACLRELLDTVAPPVPPAPPPAAGSSWWCVCGRPFPGPATVPCPECGASTRQSHPPPKENGCPPAATT